MVTFHVEHDLTMATVTFEIIDLEEDKDGGRVRVKVKPEMKQLLAKAHEQKPTSAEALAMHLARKALEYSQAQEKKASKIIIPEIVR